MTRDSGGGGYFDMPERHAGDVQRIGSEGTRFDAAFAAGKCCSADELVQGFELQRLNKPFRMDEQIR